MRWILTALTLCFLITGSAEDPLKKLESLDKELDGTRKQINLLRADCESLEKKAKTLQTAAQVTLDPSKRPPLRGKKTTLLYSSPMDSAKEWYGWPNGAKAAESQVDGKTVLQCSAPFSSSGIAESVARGVELPPGSRIKLSIWVKGEKIRPVRNGGGSRVGLIVVDKTGEKVWNIAPSSVGTFDWTQKSILVEVPEGYQKAHFNLGLAGEEGTVWMRDLRLEQVR